LENWFLEFWEENASTSLRSVTPLKKGNLAEFQQQILRINISLKLPTIET